MSNQSIILNPDVESQRSGGPKTQRWKIGSTKWLAKLTSSTDSVESAWRISGNLSNYACLSFLFYSKIFTEKCDKYVCRVCPFHPVNVYCWLNLVLAKEGCTESHSPLLH